MPPDQHTVINEVTLIDKSAWGDGPWKSEPDRLEFLYRGLPCLITRVWVFGTLNGYVGIPPEHPRAGRGYGSVSVRVHGGLTFSGGGDEPCLRLLGSGPREPQWWYLGFDCAHGFDLYPAPLATYTKANSGRDRVYRNMEYVISECKNLADQLLAMAPQIQAKIASLPTETGPELRYRTMDLDED